MRETLVNFDTAKMANTLGFNHLKANCYGDNMAYDIGVHAGQLICSGTILNYILAPTQALLQQWVRETFQIHLRPDLPYITGGWIVKAFDLTDGKEIFSLGKTKEFESYEEALEAGLQKAFKIKLIQIEHE